MASEKKDRYKASFYRLRYTVPMSTCTDMVVVCAQPPPPAFSTAEMVSRAALSTQDTKDVVASASESCVYVHMEQQSMRAHAGKVAKALRDLPGGAAAVALAVPEDNDKMIRSDFLQKQRAAAAAAAAAAAPAMASAPPAAAAAAATTPVNEFSHRQWEAAVRGTSKRAPGRDWTGYIIRITYKPDGSEARATFPDPVPLCYDLCAAAATIGATANVSAIVVDQPQGPPEHYLYVQTRAKPDRKGLLQYSTDLATVMRAVPAPAHFISNVSSREWIESCKSNLGLINSFCTIVSQDGIYTPWPPAVGIRLRCYDVVHSEVVGGFQVSNDMSVAHPRLMAAFGAASVPAAAHAIISGDQETITRFALAVAPEDPAAAAVQIVRSGGGGGGGGGVQALADGLAALRQAGQAADARAQAAAAAAQAADAERLLKATKERLRQVKDNIDLLREDIKEKEALCDELDAKHRELGGCGYLYRRNIETAQIAEGLKRELESREKAIAECEGARAAQENVWDNLCMLRELEKSIAILGFTLTVSDRNDNCVFGPSFEAFAIAQKYGPAFERFVRNIRT
jgi:hypothetical protein